VAEVVGNLLAWRATLVVFVLDLSPPAREGPTFGGIAGSQGPTR
jgi:hypothetical protein